jgi:hypothetical protein
MAVQECSFDYCCVLYFFLHYNGFKFLLPFTVLKFHCIYLPNRPSDLNDAQLTLQYQHVSA